VTLRVVVSDEFWFALEAAIPDRVRRDRFVARDLPAIKARFANDWAVLLPSTADAYYRTALGVAHLGELFQVTGRLRSDGVIELRDVAADEEGLPDPEPD
jgi:hypothetical protein